MLRELFDASDRYSVKWSSYFAVYERTFARFVGKGITFVEVGVADGASLAMWKAYFQNARIIGIDNNPAARELTTLGVEIFVGDQASEAFWNQFYETVGPIDILLDDGGHSNEQQLVTATHALRRVRNGGLILVEDVHTSYLREHLNPSRSSFVNFAKYLVDCINSRSPLVAGKRPYRDVVSSVEFHESIVIIHVDRAEAQEPTALETRGPQWPDAAVTLRSRLGVVGRIPVAGRLASRLAKWWDTGRMNRRLARFFEQGESD